MPGMGMNEADLNRVANNLYAPRPFIQAEMINLNRATLEQMQSLGMSLMQATQLLHRQGTMLTARDLPFFIGAFDRYVALFTNANYTSVREWMSLDTEMPSHLAHLLVTEARVQPFGTMAELGAFFELHEQADLFARISPFIVLR